MSEAYTRPDFATAALITIDVQCDTLDGAPLEVPGTSGAVPAMSALASAFRDARRPIVHIVRLYLQDGSNVDLCRRAAVEDGAYYLRAGAPGSQLAPGLPPPAAPTLDPELLLAGGIQELATNESAIYKPRWGAFYKTPLEDHLRTLRVSTLVFCGCNYPNCPRTSIYEASERDFRVVLARDALSGLYDRAETELTGIGVELLTVDGVADSLRSVANPHRQGA